MKYALITGILILSACAASTEHRDLAARNRANSEKYQDDHYPPRVDEVLTGRDDVGGNKYPEKDRD